MSSPHAVSQGIPEGIGLSYPLSDIALAALPEYLLVFGFATGQIEMYSDDIALWHIGSSRRASTVLPHLTMSVQRGALPYRDQSHSLPIKSGQSNTINSQPTSSSVCQGSIVR